MILRLLMWISARLPARQIDHCDRPLVQWYYLGTLFECARFQLNRFLESDPDGVHDHPWSWAIAIRLYGDYLEERRDGTWIRKAGRIYFISGDTFHRVILPYGTEAWTLFIHGPYVKPWGFLRPVLGSMVKLTAHFANGAWLDLAHDSTFIYQQRKVDDSKFSNWWKDAPLGRELRMDDAGLSMKYADPTPAVFRSNRTAA